MLAQGRLRDAEHARNVRFGNAVGGSPLGLPPLRVSRGPYRSSHWKIRPLRSATISATCIGCTFPPGDWDGVRKNEVTGSNSYSKIIARYRQDSGNIALDIPTSALYISFQGDMPCQTRFSATRASMTKKPPT